MKLIVKIYLFLFLISCTNEYNVIYENSQSVKVKDQIDDTIHERIIRTNFDNPDKILKIVSKAKTNEEKHMILFNLPEVLKA